MSKFCRITGKSVIFGNRRSRSMIATKRKFSPNLHYHRFWLEDKKRFIRIKVSAKGMRIIDRKGTKGIF